MISQIVTSRAQIEIPSVIFVGKFCLGRYDSMRSGDRLIPGASSLRLSRVVAGVNRICRQMQAVSFYELEVAATSQLGLRRVFAPCDGMAGSSMLLWRRWTKFRRNRFGVLRRTRGISAAGYLEATGLRHTSNAMLSQECDSVVLDIQGMKSGSCVARVRSLLASDKRVLSVAVSLSTETAAICLEPSASLAGGNNSKVGGELASRLTESGFTSKPRQTGKAESIFQRKEIARKRDELLKNSSRQVALAWGLGALCFATHATHLLHSVGINSFMDGTISSYLEACLSSVALLGPGRDLLVDAVNALWKKSPDVNSLVGVGAAAFCVVSAVSLAFPHLNLDASFLDVPVMLLAYVLFGRAVDGQALAEASRGTHDLLSALPVRSRLVVSETETDEPTGAGLTQGLVVGVDSEQLRPGDNVLVLPGEVIPVDGKVIKGTSLVDESMLVGKPLSVHKASGNIVSAGTVNREGPLTVEATATGAQRAVSNINKHVEEAHYRDSTVQLLADVLPGSSAFSIVSLSAATFSFWYWVGTHMFPDVLFKDAEDSGGSSFLPSLKLASDVLVVACFYPFGLATRTALLPWTSVGGKKRPSARREGFQKLSLLLDPVFSYKDKDTVARKDDAGSLTEDTTVAESEAEGEDIRGKENYVGLINDDHEAQQPGDAEKAEAWQSNDDVNAEGPGDGDKSLAAAEDAARSLSVKFIPNKLRGGKQDLVAKKDDAQCVASRVEVHTPSKEEANAEEGKGPPVTEFKVEEHGPSKQEVVTEENVARSLIVESTNEEQSAMELDFVAWKDHSRSVVVESRAEIHKGSEQELVAEKDEKESAAVESGVEGSSLCKQNVVAEKGHAGSPSIEWKVEEQSVCKQELAAEESEELSPLESKDEEHTASEREQVSRKNDPRSPTIASKAQDFKRSDKGAEYKRQSEDETERPAKKELKEREPTAKSGPKRLGREGGEPGTKTKRKKKKKDPTAPKRALSAFMWFSKLVREDLKRSQPELSFTDTGRVLGEMWQKLSAVEKAPFEAMAEADKERYKQEMQGFNPGAGKD